MKMQDLTSSLQQAVSSSIHLLEEGHNRFRVFTPFLFDDGDHFSIVAKLSDGKWMFSDEGHTFMHLSYELNTDAFNSGTRAKIIAATLENFGILEERGALICPFQESNMGAMFFAYVQALCKISDVSYLTRERVVSTFVEDCKNFVSDFVPENRIIIDYHDNRIDAQERYPVDCYVNGMQRPLHVYAVHNDSKCRDVTIIMHHFRKHDIPFESVAVFEDQEKINRRVLARFSDIVGKQFSSLAMNQKDIKKYITDKLHAS